MRGETRPEGEGGQWRKNEKEWDTENDVGRKSLKVQEENDRTHRKEVY